MQIRTSLVFFEQVCGQKGGMNRAEVAQAVNLQPPFN